VVETVDNPFELTRDFLGIDSRKSRLKKRKQMDYDWIKDEDLKRELKKGSTLLSYFEHQLQPRDNHKGGGLDWHDGVMKEKPIPLSNVSLPMGNNN